MGRFRPTPSVCAPARSGSVYVYAPGLIWIRTSASPPCTSRLCARLLCRFVLISATRARIRSPPLHGSMQQLHEQAMRRFFNSHSTRHIFLFSKINVVTYRSNMLLYKIYSVANIDSSTCVHVLYKSSFT